MMNLRYSLTAAALSVLAAAPLAAEPATYPTPQDALEAFAGALTTPGKAALLGVFGDEAADVLSTGNPVEDRLNRLELIALLSEGYRMMSEEDGSVILALGADGWPSKIPVTRTEAGRAFELEAGR